jgi:hypothetical protein
MKTNTKMYLKFKNYLNQLIISKIIKNKKQHSIIFFIFYKFKMT